MLCHPHVVLCAPVPYSHYNEQIPLNGVSVCVCVCGRAKLYHFLLIDMKQWSGKVFAPGVESSGLLGGTLSTC